MELPTHQVLKQTANEARKLAMDAIAAAKSGHLGLPLGAAEIGAALFGRLLSYNPEEPRWINRDRLVLSAGHGSMWLYAWLHLAGFNIPIEEIKRFRQKGSSTPGHPEFHCTPGVECTTGPLGQGIANAVGIAVSGKMLAARVNTPDNTLLDYKVVCLCGDGCLQEGISYEAASLAAHWGLDNLICIYDSNGVTLDAMASKTQSEDTVLRFKACGFDTWSVDGHDLEALESAYEEAAKERNGKPKLIVAHTTIGKGIAEIEGSPKAHGEGGVKFIEEAQKKLGVSLEKFMLSDKVKAYFSSHKQHLKESYLQWEKNYDTWASNNKALAQRLREPYGIDLPCDSQNCTPLGTPGTSMATRSASEKILQNIAANMPFFVSGSADLHGSTKNYMQNAGDFEKGSPAGRNLRFGIREHAMGGILNGIAYDGFFRPSGATFLAFSDYLRPAIRLAALCKLPVIYIFTHDSVAVGEDGPTHQPIEIAQSLRSIPNLDVIRPADAEETAGAFMAALERLDGPTALLLTRQDVPYLDSISLKERRSGVFKGAYIARRESTSLERILLATGSELALALKAAEQLGPSTRVVSIPCVERFQRQPLAYQNEILPPECKRRLSVEAGITNGWRVFVGDRGKSIGIDCFGFSAPGNTLLADFGMSVENIVSKAAQV